MGGGGGGSCRCRVVAGRRQETTRARCFFVRTPPTHPVALRCAARRVQFPRLPSFRAMWEEGGRSVLGITSWAATAPAAASVPAPAANGQWRPRWRWLWGGRELPTAAGGGEAVPCFLGACAFERAGEAGRGLGEGVSKGGGGRPPPKPAARAASPPAQGHRRSSDGGAVGERSAYAGTAYFFLWGPQSRPVWSVGVVSAAWGYNFFVTGLVLPPLCMRHGDAASTWKVGCTP